MYLIYCDSSIRPYNPKGVLTWAFIVKHKKKIIHKDTSIIGWGKDHHTNNLGEMTAVLAAMHWLISVPEEDRIPAIVHSDSQLIINQCSGSYSCREPRLKKLLDMIFEAKSRYGKSVIYKWIPRDKNQEADELSRSLYTEEMMEIMKANEMNIKFDWDDIPW
jgi:ribonuclease HI